MTSTKLWRGQTLRDRTADRRTQLLDAGEKLLGSQGAGAVTMRAICREAQLSPRYFYESFESREALLVAVYNRVEERLLGYIFERGLDRHTATTRDVLQSCADFFGEDPERARILLREPLADNTLRNHSASRAPSFIQTLIPLLDSEVRQVMSRRPQEIAVLTTAIGGALIALYLDWADGRLDIGQDELVDTTTRIVSKVALATQGSKLIAR
jgi:AcrR family transcriptional regulator